MKLNHLSLAVTDVGATTAFFRQYFHFRLQETKGDKIAVLNGDDNFVLVLTTAKPGEAPYPSDFHFGFLLDNEQDVNAIYEQLITDGYPVPRPPAKIRNSMAFYFHVPGGIMAEISCTL